MIAAVLRLVSQLIILFHLTVHIKGTPSDLVLSIVEHQRGVILHAVRIVALLEVVVSSSVIPPHNQRFLYKTKHETFS